MQTVMAQPEAIRQAALELSAIGSALDRARTAAAYPTISLLPAAADEVSAGIACLFSRHADDFQGMAWQAAAFHRQFVQHLSGGAAAYASAEAGNVIALIEQLMATAVSFGNAMEPLLNQLIGPFTNPLQLLQRALGTVVPVVAGLFLLPVTIPLVLFLLGLLIVNPQLFLGILYLYGGS